MKVTCLLVLKGRETDHMTNHIYKNHLEQVETLLARDFFPLPQLEIRDPENNLRGFEGLLNINYAHLNLVGYQSHGKIAAAVAV